LDMAARARQFCGITLVELIVALVVIAIVVVIAMPVTRSFRGSVETTGAKTMISSALASARAIAAKEQRYAGVRFQVHTESLDDPNGPQYIIFILHDPQNLTANGFRAIEGLKPIKLPEAMGVMDLRLGSDPNERVIERDEDIDDVSEFIDTTTFSIIFSPSGKLVIQKVRVQRQDSDDFVFNTSEIVNNDEAMFEEDSDSTAPFQKESSRRSFVIYEKKRFQNVRTDLQWSEYLRELDVIYINPYTGTVIIDD